MSVPGNSTRPKHSNRYRELVGRFVNHASTVQGEVNHQGAAPLEDVPPPPTGAELDYGAVNIVSADQGA